MSAASERSGAIAHALRRASGFVERRGDVLARERVSVLQGDASPARVAAALLPWRCEDGGFAPPSDPPPVRAGRSSVSGTVAALTVLEEAGIRRGALVEDAVAWAARVQGADGAWHARPEETLSLPDAEPDFLTGMLAGHLAKLSCGSPLTLIRAEEFLARHFSPDRVEDGDWRGLTAYAHVYANGSFELADEALQWCGRALEKGFRSGALDAIAVARIFLLCDVGAVPAGRVDAAEIVLALLPAQDEDGGFGGREPSTRARVEATLLALRTLLRFGSKGSAWTRA